VFDLRTTQINKFNHERLRCIRYAWSFRFFSIFWFLFGGCGQFLVTFLCEISAIFLSKRASSLAWVEPI
jgi:hypothetical protein